jgi:hypothetical protein
VLAYDCDKYNGKRRQKKLPAEREERGKKEKGDVC